MKRKMKHKIEVEITVKELCPKTDGNYTYINLYQKAVMCETKKQVIDDIDKLNKEAIELVSERVKK